MPMSTTAHPPASSAQSATQSAAQSARSAPTTPVAPTIQPEVYRRLAELLRAALGDDRVQAGADARWSYSYDGGFLEGLPDLVVAPTDAEEAAIAVRLAMAAGVPVVARGSGTGLCGGAVPTRGGVVITTTRMNRILAIDARNRRAVVEPGVINVALSAAARPYGLYYAPDPASQRISSIGGNVATNAGGPHCLAQGVTANHILAVQMALPSGELVWFGGGAEAGLNTPGYDLLGAVIGSEGTLGIVTRIVTRLLPLPEATRTLLAIYPDVASGSASVSAIIAAGIIPSALEMMDQPICQAVERHFHAGYPEDAGSVLLIELDGAREQVEAQRERVASLCAQHGAREVRVARSEAERTALWAGRKGAAGALGQLAPSYYLQDVVVPRSRLPRIMERVAAIAQEYRLTIPNVFHAGDGNLHPAMLFDRRRPGDIERVIAAGNELLHAAVDLGGAVSGEHGIGLEKRDALTFVYSAHDLAAMARLRGCFDPHELFNPEKIYPASASCAEVSNPQALLANGASPWFC